MALGSLWALNVLFAVVTLALVGLLLYVYSRNAREIRSRFTAGLVLFAALFLAQNVLAIWAYIAMNDAGHGRDVAFPMLLLNVMGMGAIATLLVVTWD